MNATKNEKEFKICMKSLYGDSLFSISRKNKDAFFGIEISDEGVPEELCLEERRLGELFDEFVVANYASECEKLIPPKEQRHRFLMDCAHLYVSVFKLLSSKYEFIAFDPSDLLSGFMTDEDWEEYLDEDLKYLGELAEIMLQVGFTETEL